MTRLDHSQLMSAVQGIYVDSHFDTRSSGFGGGNGGNAGGFVPSGGLHYVHRVTDDFRLGISAGSYFGLGIESRQYCHERSAPMKPPSYVDGYNAVATN